MSGVCLDQITVKFPQYPLKGIVEEDIAAGYKRQGNNPRDLPNYHKTVWGDTDFMLGIKYMRYCPEKVFQLPSWFNNADGTRGVVCGSYKVLTEIETRQRFYLISISCSKEVTKSTQMHLYYIFITCESQQGLFQ